MYELDLICSSRRGAPCDPQGDKSKEQPARAVPQVSKELLLATAEPANYIGQMDRETRVLLKALVGGQVKLSESLAKSHAELARAQRRTEATVERLAKRLALDKRVGVIEREHR